MRLAITGNRLFRDLARVTENSEQDDAGNQTRKTTQPDYHGMLLMTPALTKSAVASDTNTAHQSRPKARPRIVKHHYKTRFGRYGESGWSFKMPYALAQAGPA